MPSFQKAQPGPAAEDTKAPKKGQGWHTPRQP